VFVQIPLPFFLATNFWQMRGGGVKMVESAARSLLYISTSLCNADIRSSSHSSFASSSFFFVGGERRK
jgi:hypothetical protein